MNCPRCGTTNAPDAQFCASCGAALQPGGTVTAASARPVEYAGFLIRLVAVVIDAVILGIVGAILGAVFGALGEAGVALGNLVNILVGWFYYAYLESSVDQATLGKRVMGIKVTDMDGNRITFSKATVRYFAKILSALILFIGFIMAAFTEKHQALHDKIAGTLVVRR